VSDSPLPFRPVYEAADFAPATILVVDDDRIGSGRVAALLGELGHTPRVAHTWTEALRIFGSECIDLILMDAVMPNVDGFKLTRMLRAQATSYVPILFVTGLSDQEAKERGIASGADDFLTKPVDSLELRMRLTAMLRIRRLTQALEDQTRTLDRIAHVDALTGLFNRRSLEERLPIELERSNRYRRPVAVVMADLDHFKRVNDLHGHEGGDRILLLIGRLMRESLRGADMGFRYGGEELLIIAPETESSRASELAERLRHAFEKATAEEGGIGRQTLSCGVSGTDQFEVPVTPSELVRAADCALYQAKRTGRNRVVLFEATQLAALESAASDGSR